MRFTTNFIFLILCLLLTGELKAQLDFKETNNGGTMQLSDQTGRSLVHNNYDPEIEGSPFINTDFSAAGIVLTDGRVFKNIMAKFNLERNEIYFIDSYGDTLAATAGAVKKIDFTFPLSKEGVPYIFKSGYPATGRQDSKYFYQLLEEGSIELLKKYSKTIETFKNEMSGDVRREFVEDSFYFVFSGGSVKALKYDKAFILSLMPGKLPEIEKYLSENKISFKKISDIQKVIRYYNNIAG